MSSSHTAAVIATVVYADIFDYPLRLEEVHRRLVGEKLDMPSLLKVIRKIKCIQKSDGYYFMKGRRQIVSIRNERLQWSREKIKIAEKLASNLCIIPTVKLVGMTGGLAVENAKENDDIDIFIATSRGFMWTTRFIVTLFVEVMGRRRHPADVTVNNTICLNMFVDEDHMAIPKKERNVFSAHEVVQMKPLADTNGTYQKFLQVNEWVKEYLPNAFQVKHKVSNKTNENKLVALQVVFLPIELLLNVLQLWYMAKRRTTEVISNGYIRFHPHDSRVWILKEYKRRIDRYSKLVIKI